MVPLTAVLDKMQTWTVEGRGCLLMFVPRGSSGGVDMSVQSRLVVDMGERVWFAVGLVVVVGGLAGWVLALHNTSIPLFSGLHWESGVWGNRDFRGPTVVGSCVVT
jgi:hypothetical protein